MAGAEPEGSAPAYRAACVHALLGDTDEALRWLRTAAERGHQWIWWAYVDPDLDSLRDDPRFERIMADWQARLNNLFIG